MFPLQIHSQIGEPKRMRRRSPNEGAQREMQYVPSLKTGRGEHFSSVMPAGFWSSTVCSGNRVGFMVLAPILAQPSAG